MEHKIDFLWTMTDRKRTKFGTQTHTRHINPITKQTFTEYKIDFSSLIRSESNF